MVASSKKYFKESCNLIGWEPISVYHCVLNCWKKCFSLLRNNYSFVLNHFLPENAPQDYPEEHLGRLELWVWLGMPGHTQSKVATSHATFSCWLSPCKKSKILMLCFQRYWWSKNPATWLVQNILVDNLWTITFPDIGFA